MDSGDNRDLPLQVEISMETNSIEDVVDHLSEEGVVLDLGEEGVALDLARGEEEVMT